MAKPISPVSPSDDMNNQWYSNDMESVDGMLSYIGLDDLMQISETLQGSIWRGTHKSASGELMSSAIKVTNKYLHQSGKGRSDGVHYSVDENIVVEQAIVKYLTQQTECPPTIVKHYAFYESNQNYYFLMEFGGSSLFSFVQKAHQLIERNKIDIRHWQQVVQVILKQMLESISYIHSKNICHFDISLENVLINDVAIRVHREESDKRTEKITFVLDDIRVKLCDFGLAQLLATKQSKSRRFCGKPGYKSPEIVERKCFDPRKNDIWGLGVCLFMMSLGCSPWQKAKKSDAVFAFAMKHSIHQLLEKWNISHYINDRVLYLLHGILQYEANRVSLDNIQHFIDQYM